VVIRNPELPVHLQDQPITHRVFIGGDSSCYRQWRAATWGGHGNRGSGKTYSTASQQTKHFVVLYTFIETILEAIFFPSKTASMPEAFF